jgi:nicotinate-nucleotide pyrophosphorylase (carboxylating)
MYLDEYLAEDIGYGDLTSDTLLTEEQATARIVAKESCKVAGVQDIKAIFERFALKVEDKVNDADEVETDSEIMEITGDARAILKTERLALNIISRMSGIATQTHELVEKCRKVNPTIRIACTRKTTPGFRYYEKKAVVVGGGDSHRYRLDDEILIKDNHIKLVGGVKEALTRIKKVGFTKKIEIEVENLDDAVLAAREGANIIMLDNMAPEDVNNASKKVREVDPDIIIEVSGNITPDNILDYAPYPDVISLGWLTHSYTSKNFSMEIV